jgi:hypothetical protein
MHVSISPLAQDKIEQLLEFLERKWSKKVKS